MDPNANLAEQRRIIARISADGYCDNTDSSVIEDDALRLVELVQALDEWLSKGGFLPDAWRR